MALENELQKLEKLKVGNVEKAIREIESYKYDIEKIGNEIDGGMEEYKRVFTEKFTKAVNNIQIIKDIIFELDFIKHNCEVNDTNELKVDLKDDGDLYFTFRKKTNFIKKIQLFTERYISAKTPEEFCEKMFKSFYEDEDREAKAENLKSFYKLIKKINDIPKVISREYSDKKEKVSSSKKYINKLESLNVSDF